MVVNRILKYYISCILSIVQIVCNLLTYARNILDRDGSRVVFRATLAGGESAADSTPSCGAVIQLLQALLQRAQLHDKLLATVQHQLQSVPTMTLDGEYLSSVCTGAQCVCPQNRTSWFGLHVHIKD